MEESEDVSSPSPAGRGEEKEKENRFFLKLRQSFPVFNKGGEGGKKGGCSI